MSSGLISSVKVAKELVLVDSEKFEDDESDFLQPRKSVKKIKRIQILFINRMVLCVSQI